MLFSFAFQKLAYAFTRPDSQLFEGIKKSLVHLDNAIGNLFNEVFIIDPTNARFLATVITKSTLKIMFTILTVV